jgi:hypothetical protein
MAGPTPVVSGTHDNRLRQTGSEVDIRTAGVRSLSTLTLSLHRGLVSSGRNLSLQSGERLADLERDFWPSLKQDGGRRGGPGAPEAGLGSVMNANVAFQEDILRPSKLPRQCCGLNKGHRTADGGGTMGVYHGFSGGLLGG